MTAIPSLWLYSAICNTLPDISHRCPDGSSLSGQVSPAFRLTHYLCAATISAYARFLPPHPSAALLRRHRTCPDQFLPLRLGWRRRQEEQRLPRRHRRRRQISALRPGRSISRRTRPRRHAPYHRGGDVAERIPASQRLRERTHHALRPPPAETPVPRNIIR